MAGVRLVHPTARDGTFTFAFNKRPYKVPLVCAKCGTLHNVKTIHVQVDAQGVAYVSHEIWASMQRYNTFGGFSFANEVAKPPTQLVGMAGSPAGATPLEE